MQAYLDKEEKLGKAAEEARLLAISKLKVINVVQEEAEKIGLDPNKIPSAKAGEKFKKAQDAEHQVLKREHSQKVKRLIELNKKRAKQYMLTMTNRIKHEAITDVKIHPNTKPTILSVYRNNDKRNFDKIPKEHGIIYALPAPIPEQASSQNSGRKTKHIELEPEVKVPRLKYDRSLSKGVPFVNNMVIKDPEYGIFFTDVFGDQAFQRWNDIHKVGVDSLVSYLMMALTVKTKENEMDDPDITMKEYVLLQTERALKNEFPAIVYNDALASKSDFSYEPMVSPQHVDEISFKNETLFFEYDDAEYNVIYYNDLFPFNIFSVNDSKSDTDNDNDNIDIKQYSRDIFIERLPNVISTDIGTYAQGSNKL
ncbi:hypothetical protein Tco_1568593 [Tanacetum coccineum]